MSVSAFQQHICGSILVDTLATAAVSAGIVLTTLKLSLLLLKSFSSSSSRTESSVRTVDPEDAPKPLAKYANATVRDVASNGQVGCDLEGKFPADALAQSRNAFSHIHACLRSVGMDWENLMKVTVFLTDPSLAAY